MRSFYKIVFWALSCVVIFSLLPVERLCAQTEGGLIFLVEIDGEIKAGTLQYLKRAFNKAQSDQADYLVIKLDTPGGLYKPTQDITELILGAETKTVVFVHKESGQAFSAGTFILLAADFAFVNPTASIGAAQPVEMFGDAGASDKTVKAVASWIGGLAESRGRDPEMAEKFVRENLTLRGTEARETGIIDGTARSIEALFSELGIVNPEIVNIDPKPIEAIFDFLSHPYLVSLFLTLGGLGLILAFRTGEFEITGLVALILLLTGLWGMGIITFNILGIIFILLGIFLLFLEIIEPGFGIFGFLGAAALFFGVFVLESEPFLEPKLFDTATMLVLGILTGVLVLFIIIGRGAVKSLKSKIKTGAESLIGLEVEVIEKLNPVGRVLLDQETWRAESSNGKEILENVKVKIIKLEGNTLFVEKLEN